MGIEWIVTVHAETAHEATAAGEAALNRVAAIERVLSDYDRESEVSQLMQTAAARPGRPVPVSCDLANTLRKSLGFSDLTQGAFDVTVGPLTVLWRQARKTGRLPHPEKRAAALAATGRGAVVLHDEENGPSVSLLHPATRLDFGGIGMGYAIDEAMKLLADRGITSAMIDASGDIAVSGPPPGRDHWRIAVPPLMRAGTAAANSTDTPTLALSHAAVTTSGDAYQAVIIDGIRYSHIVDPRTGLGVTGPTAVTVIAADATTADALSTGFSVLGPAAGLDLIEKIDGAAARFSWVADDRLQVEASPRWKDFREGP
jgi:thiamine biosynthesis lipoprotein